MVRALFGADVFSVFFGMPVYAVSWENTTRLFAAAVTDSSDLTLDATTFLFADQPRSVTIRFWHLRAGSDFVLEAGPSSGPGTEPDSIDQSVEFTYSRRGDGAVFTLPPRIEYGIRVRPVEDQTQEKRGTYFPELLPDLGLSEVDIAFDSETGLLEATVHNVGSQTARNITVHVYQGFSAEGNPIATTQIQEIEAPIDLVPKFVTIQIPLSELHWQTSASHPNTGFSVVLDPENQIEENCEQNNTAVLQTNLEGNISMPPMITDVDHLTDSTSIGFRLKGRHFHPNVMALVSGDPHEGFQISYSSDTVISIILEPNMPYETVLLSLKNPDGKVSNIVPLANQEQ